MNGDYPVRFTNEYPDRDLDRLTTALRIFTVIPIAIVLGSIGGYSASWVNGAGATSTIAVGGTGLRCIWISLSRRERGTQSPAPARQAAACDPPLRGAVLSLYVGAFFAAIEAWLAILFTSRNPRGIFDYIEGVIRWHNRVVGYALLLVTDRYPPFRLSL